jgi:hypothetical protein
LSLSTASFATLDETLAGGIEPVSLSAANHGVIAMTMPTCPRCGRDVAVTSITAPGGGQLYTCWFSHEGEGHISLQTASKSETTISSMA